ncbi:hypothetical protein [Chryseobacterium sp. NFX27]|uniref:hypothetical protein n=1 Tax=Chryseobacterium sp. NFX27 TaxID=2819618 RepID=UPI003CE69F8F
MQNEFKYYNGEDIEDGNKSLEYSSNTLKEMRKSAEFDSKAMETYSVRKDIVGSKYYSQTSDGFFDTADEKAYAYTTRPIFFTMKSEYSLCKGIICFKRITFCNYGS